MTYPGLMIWDYHYAKALEIIAADIVHITGRLESGKAVNILFIISTFLLSFHFSLTTLKMPKKRIALLLSTILILNPVVICQMFTYYIDFSIYLYWINTILASINIVKKQDSIINYIILDFTVILAIGTKFNAFFIEGVIIALIIIGFYIFRYKSFVKSYTINIFFVGLIGAFIIGYHPYVTNWMLHGNPLYPLLGNPDIDIMTPTTPPEFLESNRFLNFFSSVFSLTPMSYDTRKGGFGPVFGIILILCMITLLLKVYKEKQIRILSYIMISVIATCFIFEQAWWARYNPQLWLIVPLCYYELYKSNTRVTEIIRRILVIIVGVNSFVGIANTIRLSSMMTIERKVLFNALQGDSVFLYNSKINWIRQLEENGVFVIDEERKSKEYSDTVYIYGFKSDKYHYPFVKINKEKHDSILSITNQSMFHNLTLYLKQN